MVFHMLRGAPTESIVFRPHNIYGPAMGFEHVVPEFALRLLSLKETSAGGRLPFPIQGDGTATRSFCHIDDAVDGIIRIGERGEDGTIYHLGVPDEITIADLAHRMADVMGVEIDLVPRRAPEGQTSRRCPDIARLRTLGYVPTCRLEDGLAETAEWYEEWARQNPDRWAEWKARQQDGLA